MYKNVLPQPISVPNYNDALYSFTMIEQVTAQSSGFREPSVAYCAEELCCCDVAVLGMLPQAPIGKHAFTDERLKDTMYVPASIPR